MLIKAGATLFCVWSAKEHFYQWHGKTDYGMGFIKTEPMPPNLTLCHQIRTYAINELPMPPFHIVPL